LQYNARAITSGAQTERRGDAGPVRDLLGGKAAPAVSFRSVRRTFWLIGLFKPTVGQTVLLLGHA
jgi:hypothetical protein